MGRAGFDDRRAIAEYLHRNIGDPPSQIVRLGVFLSTTGDVLNEEQQLAFEIYVRNGGAYIGIHAAADTEYDWPWYGGLVGAWFRNHPEIQTATVEVSDPAHSSTHMLPERWESHRRVVQLPEPPARGGARSPDARRNHLRRRRARRRSSDRLVSPLRRGTLARAFKGVPEHVAGAIY